MISRQNACVLVIAVKFASCTPRRWIGQGDPGLASHGALDRPPGMDM